jgi:hypothetical protein
MSLTAPLLDSSPMVADVSHEPELAQHVVRRRPSQAQGQALERLGRAIEYLMDSRLALTDEPSTRADREALEILMRLNRSVFSECEEIVPMRQRLKTWMADRVRTH